MTPDRFQSRLKPLRAARGLSQGELADRVGLTRQAIYMIEAGRYLPNATTALRLAKALECRVEDIFLLEEDFERIEAELPEGIAEPGSAERMKLWKVQGRSWALPVSVMGEPSHGLLSADALLSTEEATGGRKRRRTLALRALEDPALLERQIAVAGCDPALFVIADRLLRGTEPLSVVVWSMGSTDALKELGKRTVHLAGVHLRGPRGEFNIPFLRKHLGRRRTTLVTLAFWQMGLVVAPGNPRSIRSVADLARRGVRIVNREKGSGARQLLDRKLAESGVPLRAIGGYENVLRLHTDVARRVLEGGADAAIAPLAVARLLGLDFVPLETERYDLVVPKDVAEEHPGVQRLLDALSTSAVRRELDALGGYDTTHTGEVVAAS
ncbi:MAG TPA: substrate-binding domain-containing protein [Vicinamibacteria bacterium]|jgi:molybdate-binding protein/DNA-binding XRE family transcriptional regulator